ncbi:MAG: radical SAM protein [Candidatus Zixiibacteriota bacterium]
MNSKTRTLSIVKRGFINYISKRPFCISFEVTHCCNARCDHCHLGGKIEEQRATPQRYGEICRQIQPIVALVSGGEPLLRKDLVEIVKAIRGPNGTPVIAMTTNGLLLTREKYLKLREAGVDRFSISLDYPDERHDKFRHLPGLFKQIKKLVNDLESDNDKAINISCVVQRQNFRDIIRIAELGKEWNVKVNYSTYTWLRTNKKDFLLSREDLPEFKDIIKQLIHLKRINKNIRTSEYVFNQMIKFFETKSLPQCRAGEKYFVVNADGTFSPCGLVMRNYNSQDEIIQEFTKNNNCIYCYTSLRADCETPIWHLIKDNFRLL